VDQSKSNGDLDVAGDGGATISPKAKVSVQSLIILWLFGGFSRRPSGYVVESDGSFPRRAGG
jgi:hypothetical protein